jgi:hypothetical protein
MNVEQEITSDLGAFVRAEPAAAIFKSGGAPTSGVHPLMTA